MNRRATRTLGSRLGTRDDDPLAMFVRGATVGAFVGAVIAGSTIWRRLRRRAGSAPLTTGVPSAGGTRAPRRGPAAQPGNTGEPRTR
jgi:hypothetical protein